MDAAPPLDNGRYRLVDVLGEGGMATVYRAWDARLEVWRAIKVLDAKLSGRAALRRRFENEARTMARLHDRHIVTVHDVGVDEGRVFMVMELVEGGSLVDWVEAHGAMPARMAADVLTEVLAALQMAHDNNVVHRDIKPHNILVGRDGTPKVSDFGIARLADTDQSFTRTGAMMGTWSYMAPEQRTSARRVDGRADVYAAGATLFALVTAREPHDLFNAELHDELFEHVPEKVSAVIKRATRYKPEDRYDSATAMRTVLLDLRGELPPAPEAVPSLVVHALTRGASAPPPTPRAGVLAAAHSRSDPTYHMGTATHGGVAAVEAEPTGGSADIDMPDGTLSDEGVVSLADRSSTAATIIRPEPKQGRWAFGVLLALALGVVGVVLGGAGVVVLGPALFGTDDPAAQAVPEVPIAEPPVPEPIVEEPAPEPVAPEPVVEQPAPEPPVPRPSVAPRPAVVVQPRPAPAPVPVPEPVGPVQLKVNTIPHYSDVFLDGVRIGRTPLTTTVDGGAHSVVLEGSKGGRTELGVDLAGDTLVCWDWTAADRCR